MDGGNRGCCNCVVMLEFREDVFDLRLALERESYLELPIAETIALCFQWMLPQGYTAVSMKVEHGVLVEFADNGQWIIAGAEHDLQLKVGDIQARLDTLNTADSVVANVFAVGNEWIRIAVPQGVVSTDTMKARNSDGNIVEGLRWRDGGDWLGFETIWIHVHELAGAAHFWLSIEGKASAQLEISLGSTLFGAEFVKDLAEMRHWGVSFFQWQMINQQFLAAIIAAYRAMGWE